MSITYCFDQERRLILTRVAGALTIALTEDYFARLQQDESCPEGAIEIVDFSDVTNFALKYGEMVKITQSYQSTKTRRNIWATIFNCKSSLSYGIARMLQTLHEISNEAHTVVVTKSREELARCVEELRPAQGAAGESQ